MAIRNPRGYAVNRPPYVELCEGKRPNVQALPLEAWTGLPPVRIDEKAHDPIVIDAGTIVGISTGTYAGKMFPAIQGYAGTGSTSMTYHFESDDATWGLLTSDQTVDDGNIKPIGVVFQPIYSFNLAAAFTNYKRVENVGIVTNYVIQVPAITTAEHLIRAGDVVMVAQGHLAYGRISATGATVANLAGRFAKYSSTTGTIEYVVGRCLKSFIYATGTASTKFQSDSAAAVSTAGKAEFPGLDLVETVPGLALSGSGTGGVPGHLLGGYADASGNYRALTILVRL